MAGMEKHDENVSHDNAETNATDNIAVNVTENNSEDVVSSVATSDNTDEILLYVEDGNQGVQDLIRVALNQGLTTGELQQQLQDSGASITLQNLGETHAIISMQHNNSVHTGSTHLLSSDGGITQHSQGEIEGKANDLNNLFQLANLSGTLSSETERIQTDAMVEVDVKMETESHKKVVEDAKNDVSPDGAVIEDYIIANVDPKETGKIPGEFNVGDAFYSLEEVEEALRLYEEKHDVKLYKRDVRSLEALLKRSLKLQKLDKINESLKYGQLLYCCVYGGKRKAQKMACMDESGLARYTDCKMFIRFAISDDGMKLVVNGKLEKHNHEEVVTDEQNTEPLYVTNTGNADEIRLGAGFVDLEELYKAIHKYETDKHVHLWRRDGRTVEALAKRAPGTARKIMETNPGLRFAELRFCCSYGGRHLSDDKKEKMRSSNSFKQGCEMHIRFGVSDDGSQLVVKSISEEHNHEINEETVVKEALHPELCSYVSKLVWSDSNVGIDEVKKQLESYVCNEMFKNQSPPPRTRRQYFPSKKQIRYFMAKAKASLNISQEVEQKLEAQAEKLRESHSDEKMIFNFKVQHDVSSLDLTVNPEESMVEGEEELLTNSSEVRNDSQNAKVLFCHQTPHQQRLLKRYNSQLILTQINDIHSKIPFPLYCLYVQTNVDFQLVGEFILQTNTSAMITEGLQTLKEWNPGWSPKFVIVDFTDEQINAVENVFPGAFVLISDASREKAWSDWLSAEYNGVAEHKDEVLKYLQAIACSFSEDTLNTAARELEESDVWKMSDKMRNWFQLHWLSQAKRWVAGYRPDDYLLTCHNGRSLEDELKVLKSIKLVNKTAPLQDVIQQLVEHVVPVARKQYELLNQESFKLQNELYYLYPDIPNYLSCRPGKLTFHVYERIKSATEQSYIISYLHPGIFSVQGNSPEDDILHTVSFGDSSSFPSCDCADWQQFKLPCVHQCAVFNNYPGWTWDMLSVAYKSCPALNVDWSAVSNDNAKEVPGYLIDSGTQTSGATLLSSSSEFSKISKMDDGQRVTETPQVLATQCRGLLQQLSKLQLAHHSRENLYRLKSELKELIAIFSSAPKQKQPLANPGLTGTYVIQSKGPGRPRKVSMLSPSSNSAQTVFEMYNIKPVTPKQVNDATATKAYSVRSRTSSTELVISKPVSTSDEQENLISTVYIVDPSQVLSSTTEKRSSNLEVQAQTRKRIQSPSVFLKPPEKRAKQDEIKEDENVSEISKLEDLQQSVSLDCSTLLTVGPDTEVSAVIDGQAISIPLSEVSVAMSSALEGNLNPETFSTASTAIGSEFNDTSVENSQDKNLHEPDRENVVK